MTAADAPGTRDEPDVPAVERLIDLVLFGPLTLGACVVERIPAVADRARRELVLARIVGKMAVDGGARELRRRVREATRSEPSPDAATSAAAPVDTAAGAEGSTTEVIAERGRPAAGDDGDVPDVPDAAELALPDYDHLPASHVVGKLAGLSASERDLIERYERANRHRRTVLGKLDQLRGRAS